MGDTVSASGVLKLVVSFCLFDEQRNTKQRTINMSWQSEVEVYLAMMMVERRSSFDFGMPCIQVQASYYFFGRMIQILLLRTYRYITCLWWMHITTPHHSLLLQQPWMLWSCWHLLEDWMHMLSICWVNIVNIYQEYFEFRAKYVPHKNDAMADSFLLPCHLKNLFRVLP